MPNSFPITYLGTIVGHIEFIKEGLYWNYEGNFNMKKDGIYRVYGRCPNGLINLGVSRPDHGLWRVCGKVSGNSIDLKDIYFTVNSTEKPVRFVPIKEESPFDCLEQLDGCRFACCEDCPGVMLYGQY